MNKNEEPLETDELSEMDKFLAGMEEELKILTASPYVYPELFRR